MAASREDLRQWFDHGVLAGATHLIIVTDEFDWSDHAVFVSAEEDAREVVAGCWAKPLMRVTEVYNLRMDKEAQMAEHRAFHYETEDA